MKLSTFVGMLAWLTLFGLVWLKTLGVPLDLAMTWMLVLMGVGGAMLGGLGQLPQARKGKEEEEKS